MSIREVRTGEENLPSCKVCGAAVAGEKCLSCGEPQLSLLPDEQAKCGLCGEPMPPGENMFKFHGYSGPCPKPPMPKQREPWDESYVGYLRFRKRQDNQQSYLQVCDSDSIGAFKVWRESAIVGSVSALRSQAKSTEMELRRIMWQSHGHIGYGDDGEMQCCECGMFGCWDYKRQPMTEVRTAYYMAITTRANTALLPEQFAVHDWYINNACRFRDSKTHVLDGEAMLCAYWSELRSQTKSNRELLQGECVDAPTALSGELKASILRAPDALLAELRKQEPSPQSPEQEGKNELQKTTRTISNAGATRDDNSDGLSQTTGGDIRFGEPGQDVHRD